MKRILVGFIMDGRSGGIDNYLLNLLENVWEPELRIDFLSDRIDEELQERLKPYKSRIFAIPSLRRPFAQYRFVKKLIQKENYDTLYFNISTAIDFISPMAGKSAGVKRRLIHSHSSGNDSESSVKRRILDGVNWVCRKFLYRFGTEFYGCSKKAGLWIFPKKVVESPQYETILNAVDFSKFHYSEEERKRLREELNIKDSLVLGNVGNLRYQKNQEFLIRVMKEVVKTRRDVVLLIVGEGPRKEWFESLVKEENLTENIRFLGFRKDVNALMNGMDVFLLPSRFEGLPTVGVEAQCVGLPCLMSDTITREVKITKDCEFLTIQDEKIWVDKILRIKSKNREEIQWLSIKDQYRMEALKEKQRKLLR